MLVTDFFFFLFGVDSNGCFPFLDFHFIGGVELLKEIRKGQPTHRRGHFSPLEHHILRDPAVGVDIHPLILIADKHFHPIRFGQDDDGMRSDVALNLGDEERPRIT